VLVLYATAAAPLIPDAARAFRHRVCARRAGGDPDQPDHGAGDIGPNAPASVSAVACARRSRRASSPPAHGRDRQGHGGPGSNCCSNIIAMLLVLVAWSISPMRPSGCCPRSAAQRFRCSDLLGYLMAPVCWLMGLAMVAWRSPRGKPDGHQDVAERADRLCRSVKTRPRRARSAFAADHAVCDVAALPISPALGISDRRHRHHGTRPPATR